MVMWYYVDRAHDRHGPITAEALARAFREGRVQRDSLVWREGMTQWEPLESHLQELPAPPPAAPVPVAPPTAPPQTAAQAPVATDIDHVVDAGFIRRLGAFIIDNMLLGTAYYAVLMVGMVVMAVAVAGATDGGAVAATGAVLMALAYAVMSYFYYVGMERSKLQATVGKLALGIKVVDADGRRLGWGKASARWAGSLVSYLILYFGFFMAGWTRRKQALHDLMAGTYVVDKWAYTEQPGRQKEGVNGAVVAVVALVLVGGAVMVLGILAAIAIPAYQDYLDRARITEVVAEGSAQRAAIEEFRYNTDRCPRDPAEAGLAAPTNANIREMLVIESESGGCDLALVLASSAELKSAANGVLYLRDNGDGGYWCEADGVPDKLLPASCR
ncbi:RDD family protein [Arenimonas caeni]|jgi:uncharacterized RDD family membrane protein YckC/Tfp pilus assembly protein PilE|uniref:RDD family protein n=1 Tax=Arenimonas caeni TaxID=2058085 RepID=UPI002A35ED0D|nr:RDD family protein [Arenimonas caeni]MDY0021511.1 RDD family protein [Arenimonas caeni]